jgi:NADH-quinone oxidoreductase subunit C
MSAKLETLARTCRTFGERIGDLRTAAGEVTLEVAAEHYLETARILRDHPDLRFEQLIDLTGVDYSSYGRRRLDRACALPPSAT